MKTYDYNDIARYAENDMTDVERQEFEQALATDASLKEQLALYREAHVALQQYFSTDEQQEALQQTLLNIRDEFFPAAKSAKVVSINRTLRYAVGIAAVFIATLFIWQPWQPNLFKEYSDTQMVSTTERGENTDTLLQQAVVAFNNKDFSTAAGLLEKVVQQKPADSYAGFYYGIALLHTNRVELARNYFTQLFAGESAFKYEAAFYLALTYLKEDNKTACREWLQKIPADAANYAKAQALLKEL